MLLCFDSPLSYISGLTVNCIQIVGIGRVICFGIVDTNCLHFNDQFVFICFLMIFLYIYIYSVCFLILMISFFIYV